jgi:hypothetical protein
LIACEAEHTSLLAKLTKSSFAKEQLEYFCYCDDL